MPTDPRDLLIHYDEATGELVVHSVRVADAQALREAQPAGVPVHVDDLRDVAPDVAEQHVGALLLSMIDHFAIRKIGVRDYAGETAREQAQHVAELETLAAGGDAEAQFELFGQLQMLAWKTLSQPLLDRADAMLAAAAAQGLEEALAMATRWPLIKSVAERRIAGTSPS